MVPNIHIGCQGAFICSADLPLVFSAYSDLRPGDRIKGRVTVRLHSYQDGKALGSWDKAVDMPGNHRYTHSTEGESTSRNDAYEMILHKDVHNEEKEWGSRPGAMYEHTQDLRCTRLTPSSLCVPSFPLLFVNSMLVMNATSAFFLTGLTSTPSSSSPDKDKPPPKAVPLTVTDTFVTATFEAKDDPNMAASTGQ